MADRMDSRRTDIARLTGELVMGEAIIGHELAGKGDFAVVTTQTPWEMVRDVMPATSAVITAGSLERSSLDVLIDQVPAGAEIVGVGGGLALDVAKYLARARNHAVTLVPTAMSSNGPFTNWISIRRHGQPAGFQDPDLPRQVIVDFDIISRANPRMNRAGYGDLLPLHTTLTDWEIAAEAGGTPVDPDVLASGRALMHQVIDSATRIGALDRNGLDSLVRLLRESTALMLSHPGDPLGAGSEHLFPWTLESVVGSEALHGELVALGIVISSYLQQRDHKLLVGALRDAQVACHPDDLGLTWDDIERTLLAIDRYNRDVRKFHTVYDHVELTPPVLSGIREVLLSLARR